MTWVKTDVKHTLHVYHDFTDEIGLRKDQNAYIHMECITLGEYYVD